MSTYIVIQSFVESGSWQDHKDDNLKDLYDNFLIPSFAKYCKKYNYHHVVYRNQNDIIEKVNKKHGTKHGNLYHQYISALNHKDDDIDYFVFPDVDFYITDYAKPFPQTKYIAGDLWTAASLIKRGKDPEKFKAVWGGIQIMTKEAAMSLATYIESRMMNYLLNDTPMLMHPNMITVGEWLTENNIEIDELNFQYNHILDNMEEKIWDEHGNDSGAGFWHLYGMNKTKKLEYILKHIDKGEHNGAH